MGADFLRDAWQSIRSDQYGRAQRQYDTRGPMNVALSPSKGFSVPTIDFGARACQSCNRS